MPYVQADVEIDMSDIDTCDLVDEMVLRLKGNRRKKLTDDQKEELREELKEINKALNFEPDQNIEVRTLEDRLKLDHLLKVFHKYSSWQLIDLLPE